MKYSLSLVLLITVFSSFPLCAQASGTSVSFGQLSTTFTLNRSDTLYQLPQEFIIEGSEHIVVDSVRHLERLHDFRMIYRYGQILFPSKYLASLCSDSLPHKMTVTYRALPMNFKHEYSLRQIEILWDSVGKERKVVSQLSTKLFSDDFFGSGLQKSGSIVRGFSVGSNNDLSLNSGFRMQLAGKLAQDVDVTAALTDENSPLQPEGTTKTLQEVDKVYIEIKTPHYSATLGDFDLQIDQKEGGEFGRLNRKLQGGQGTASFDHIGGSDLGGSMSLTGATARGKYATNQFQGIEGVQGPYLLKGNNGENRLVIIAGSERVYLDDELMTRGEVNDYVIDYTSGEITFSSRRLITNASRITIDFEYSDQQFVRNLIAGSLSESMFGHELKLNISFAQEADDPDSPIDFSLNDSTRAILRQSGGDRMKASVSGIVKVDSGNGQYILQDTIINGRHYSILEYSPGDPLARYTAYFSPVDSVPADSAGYDRIASGEFHFKGIGQGSYIPVQFLPMPQLHQVIDVNGQASLGSDFSLSGEYAMSRFDQNRFSLDDSSSMKGGAFMFAARYNPKRLIIGGSNIGEVDAHISDRFVDRRFLAMDRVNEVEFNRKWNLTEDATTDEDIQEFSLAYRPTRSISGAATYGALDRPGEVHSTRTQIDLGIADSNLAKVQYQIEVINTSNALLNDESHWTRQHGIAEYEIAKWRPGFCIESEERIAMPTGLDSMSLGSFRFLEIAPRLTTAEFSKMTASVELQFRTEDSATVGSLHRASQAVTQLYTWQLNNNQLLSSSLALNLRNVEFTDEFKLRGNLNSNTVLVRSQTRFTPFQRAIESDLYYEFSNQRSAQLERVFVRVTPGSGNYKYLGDMNGNGIVDENDFELTRFDGDYIVTYVPSDQLYPTSDLKASIRLRLQPARLIPVSSTWFNKVLRAISTETYLRVDENSKETDTKQIYLLNFSRFLNDQTTIAGSQQITQDIFLFENNSDLSFRFRYNEQYGLTQFVSGVEQSYTEERSIRMRSQLVQEIGNQTDFINKTDQLTASPASTSERDLVSNALLSDFSYKPVLNWEVGFNFGVTEIVNSFGGTNATANINVEGMRIVQSFPGVGQLHAEVNREEVVLVNVKDPTLSLPYEFTEGKVIGQSYLWQLIFDYRITSNLQLSINYNGRSEGGRTPVHFVRMEAKAFF
ncbi:MAG: hypothetical protein ABSA44_05645 [Bacteroidota bacterium]|jgi:hypothetical protein